MVVDPATGQAMVRETNVLMKSVDPETGYKMINNYVVVKELGRGVHGKVKLCMNVDTEEFVVGCVGSQWNGVELGTSQTYTMPRTTTPFTGHQDHLKTNETSLRPTFR